MSEKNNDIINAIRNMRKMKEDMNNIDKNGSINLNDIIKDGF